ncbi:GlxA family transcriptional regulator [Mycobacterium camsae]|uniref:GlxA family transcriptional regulator n=1 Tax=Mycobacterium gordonae TaxID=1778 RepID=UPI00197DC7FD|nr:helix-turn-helix domain-containing protein [Mycobacterium gordonae]
MIVIVVFDDVTLLDVAGAGEVFAEANRAGAEYQLKIASVDGQDVTTSIGTRLGVTDVIASIESADTVLVAGSDDLPRRPVDPALVKAIRSIAGRTRRLASICTGSFILAQAGLLQGRRATTHWHEVRLFARAFPDVAVEPDAIFVQDGEVFTSAGVSSGKVTAAISANPADNHSVHTLAARASVSTRQLTRLFQAELGTTPARYVEMVRIDAARAALDAGRTVAETARLAGFGSPESLRRVFVEHLGVSPNAYRERFRTAARG